MLALNITVDDSELNAPLPHQEFKAALKRAANILGTDQCKWESRFHHPGISVYALVGKNEQVIAAAGHEWDLLIAMKNLTTKLNDFCNTYPL